MISAADILSGIREASRGVEPWAAVELDDPCPPTAAIAAGLQAHFGVVFATGDLDQLTTVRALAELLQRKFAEE